MARPRLLGTDWNFWPDAVSLERVWATCSALGFAGMELGVYGAGEELRPERTATIRELSDRHGLGVEAVLYSMPPPRWPEGGLAGVATWRQAVDDATDTARRGAELGATILGLWPGADRPGTPDGWARTGAALHELGEAVSVLGMTLAVEPKPGQLVGSTDETLRLCQEVGHPRVGVLLDTGHALAAGEDLAALPDLLGRHLFHVHLGDSDGDADADLPPGARHDFTRFFARLLARGYEGAASFDLYGAVAGSALTGEEASRQGLAHVVAALGAATAV